MLVTGCVVSGLLGRDSGSVQCQMLPVTCPGQPGGVASDPHFVAASVGPGYA